MNSRCRVSSLSNAKSFPSCPIQYTPSGNSDQPIGAASIARYRAIDAAPMGWSEFPEGVYWIGHEGNDFAFDNEETRHREFIQSFRLASRLVTNAEYLSFMQDGGYQRPEFWLSMGWATVQQERWRAPLYWEEDDGAWWQYTLSGLRQVDPAEPLTH